MSGASYQEFLLLLVIGLIVLGPKRLPEIASKIGGWIGQARRMTRVMRRQLEEELSLDELHEIQAPPDAKAAPPPESKQVSESAPLAAEAATPETAGDAPEHIPNDDDNFSPLHGEDDHGKRA